MWRTIPFVAVALAPAAWAQVPDVVELRYPDLSTIRIAHDWGYRLGSKIAFLGDVDGDGLDDFITYQVPRTTPARPAAVVVVFGVAEPLQAVRGEALRHTALTMPDEGYIDDRSYGPAGDVDGDGYDDLLIASPFRVIEGRPSPGRGGALVVFGGPDLPEEVSLEDLWDPAVDAGVRVMRILGPGEEDMSAGREVAHVGDLNGDGLTDIAITCWGGAGTRNGERSAGAVYVVYGGFPTDRALELGEVGSAVPGFVVRGAYGWDALHREGDSLGASPCGIGDVNGDGFADFAVGADRASRGGNDRSGLVYVILGGSDIPAELTPEAGDSSGGRIVTFIAPGFVPILGNFGTDVAGAGDVDGDGLDDFLIGASGPSAAGIYAAGYAFLIYGSGDWEPVYDTPERYAGLRHFVLEGSLPPFPYDYGALGYALAGVGDWNGDGFDDFIITAPGQPSAHDGGSHAGRAYLVYGGRDLPRRALDTEVGLSVGGVVIHAEASRLNLGQSVSAGGEFNGDGTRDLLLASPFRSSRNPASWENPADSLIYILPGPDQRTLALSAVVPGSGGAGGGTRVVLWGSGFSGEEEVRFGGIRATVIEVQSTSRLVAIVPAGAEFGPVDVEVSRGEESARLAHGFTYREEPLFGDLELDGLVLGSGLPGGLVIHDLPSSQGVDLSRGRHMEFGDVNGDGLDDLVVGLPQGGDLVQGQVTIRPRAEPPSARWPAATSTGTASATWLSVSTSAPRR